MRRPKVPKKKGAANDLELMEHLVKKSLDVNPSLRNGRDTNEVLKGLKEEAVRRSATAGTATGKKAKLSQQQRRKETISFFFEQKSEQFQEQAQEILERQRQLVEEKETLRAQYGEEIIDFLTMVAGGSGMPEAREVLREFRAFLTALGLSEAEVIERMRAGRKT